MSPEWIGSGEEVINVQTLIGPAEDANKGYGSDEGLGPERAGKDFEESLRIRDAPSGGEKPKVLRANEKGSTTEPEGNAVATGSQDNREEDVLEDCSSHSKWHKKSQGERITAFPMDTSTTTSDGHVSEAGSEMSIDVHSKQSQNCEQGSTPTELRGQASSGKQHVENVCILAESSPTWIAVADCWGANLIEVFSPQPREVECFIKGLGVRTKTTILPTVLGVSKGGWRSSKNAVLLIQGSAKFCHQMVTGLVKIGVTSNSKIIIASTQKIRRLDLKFRFIRLAHDVLGGVTNSTHHIGFTEGIVLTRKDPRESDVRRTMLGGLNMMVDGPGIKAPENCKEGEGSTASSPSDYHSQLDLFMDTFQVPCVYSPTGWCERELTGKEFFTAMDIPSSVIKYASAVGVFEQDRHGCILSTPPLKVLQEVGDMLFGTNQVEGATPPEPVKADFILHSKIDGLEEIYDEINQAKAAKNDDAEADYAIWYENLAKRPSDWATDWCIVGQDYSHSYEVKYFDLLRNKMHERFCGNVERSYVKHMKEAYSAGPATNKTDDAKVFAWKYERDQIAGLEAINKAKSSSFWEWDDGSFPFFWRWQPEVQKDLRDGTKLWVQGELPSNTNFKQNVPKVKEIFEKMKNKMRKIRGRGYIAPSWVRSLSSFFEVPKGDDDIRMVFDMSASGLNDALWVPNFWMPSVHNVLNCSTHSSWYGDVDAGEIFLNFPLDLAIRPYCGVDFTWMEEGETVTWESWQRMTMGMKPSPWVTCRLI